MAKQRTPEGEVFLPQHRKLWAIATTAAAACTAHVEQWERADKTSPERRIAVSAMSLGAANADATVAITFAAFAAECFINGYAGEFLDGAVFDLVERTPAEAKWRLFPLLVQGKELPTEPLRGIKALYDARNQFAHSKPRWRTFAAWERTMLAQPPYRSMAAHLAAVRAASISLRDLDDRVDVRWLDGGPSVMRLR